MKIRCALLSTAAVCFALAGCAGKESVSAGTAQPSPLAGTAPQGSPARPADSAANGGIALHTANPPRQAVDAPVAATSGPDAMRAVPCATRDLSLKPGADNGDFNGMSHSGTYLLLTNKSRNACSVPGQPQLTFLDENGPVSAAADLPGAKFMHPGPVVLPIVLQPKHSVRTSARWVSGPVFQDNLCYKITGVTLALRNGSVMTPLIATMCGERSKGVHYDLQRYGAQ